MRIVIIAPGSRGDVQPYVALGRGLHGAGHFVRFVTHHNFHNLITSHGLDFWSVESDIQGIVESQAMRERIENGNFITLLAQLAREAQREALIFAETSLAACKGMDLILAGLGGLYTGLGIAEKLHLPLLQAYVVPVTPTREFPSVLTPSLPSPFNRFSHQVARQIMWQGFRSADTLARKKTLGLSPAPFLGPYDSERTRGLPILYGFSPTVISRPQDWGQNVCITGFWFLDEEDGWTPPPALSDFLNAGPPPVYIGFGSLSNRSPEQTADLIINALRKNKQRAILLSGWGGLKTSTVPDSIFVIDAIPHSWLFPRVAAVVHHGGASTTAAGLRAGVPSLVIPFFGDQPYWGRRVAELGVGPRPIPWAKLTVERLAHGIGQAVTDKSMQERAKVLGDKIQQEDGIPKAVEIFHRLEYHH